jgi:hypothetical protein
MTGQGASPESSDPTARIQKPFTAQTLLQAVQQALNAG